MDTELEIEAVYYLLRLEALARGELRLYKKTVYKPETRIPLPTPLDKKHASPAFMFWKPIPRPSEANAMFRWMNGYFIDKFMVDDTGSLEDALRQARIERVVTPKDFDYNVRPSWEVKSALCPKCMRKWPRTRRFWHTDNHGFDRLRSDACIFCRSPAKSQRLAQVLDVQPKAA